MTLQGKSGELLETVSLLTRETHTSDNLSDLQMPLNLKSSSCVCEGSIYHSLTIPYEANDVNWRMWVSHFGGCLSLDLMLFLHVHYLKLTVSCSSICLNYFLCPHLSITHCRKKNVFKTCSISCRFSYLCVEKGCSYDTSCNFQFDRFDFSFNIVYSNSLKKLCLLSFNIFYMFPFIYFFLF